MFNSVYPENILVLKIEELCCKIFSLCDEWKNEDVCGGWGPFKAFPFLWRKNHARILYSR